MLPTLFPLKPQLSKGFPWNFPHEITIILVNPIVLPTFYPHYPLVLPTLSIIIPHKIACWWFQTFFIFHHIWDNPSHWLIFFRGVGQPPASMRLVDYGKNVPSLSHHYWLFYHILLIITYIIHQVQHPEGGELVPQPALCWRSQGRSDVCWACRSLGFCACSFVWINMYNII